MSIRTRVLFSLVAAAVSMPAVASAQECNPIDAAAQRCFLDPTPAQSTVSPAGVGFGGGSPISVAARYLGGIALFQSDVYFFQGFFSNGFDAANPLARAADYTQIGGKPYDQSAVYPPGGPGWIALPGTINAAQELVFGIRVQGDGPTDRWFFSGYGAYGYDRNPLVAIHKQGARRSRRSTRTCSSMAPRLTATETRITTTCAAARLRRGRASGTPPAATTTVSMPCWASKTTRGGATVTSTML